MGTEKDQGDLYGGAALRRLAVLGMFLGLLGGEALSATIHVPAGSPTVAAGLAAASTGDTVLLAAGSLFAEFNLTIPNGVVLRGAGADTIDAIRSGRVFSGVAASTDSLTAIENIVFRRGYTAGGGSFVQLPNSGHRIITIRDCRIENSRAAATGGVIFLQSGPHLRIEGTTFFEDTCSTYGGAIYSTGFLESRGNRFDHCYAGMTSGTIDGGAWYLSGAVVISEADTFMACAAADAGGAINAFLSAVYMSDTVARADSSGKDGAGDGGFLYNIRSVVILRNPRIDLCTALNGAGGAIFNTQATLMVLGGEIDSCRSVTQHGAWTYSLNANALWNGTRFSAPLAGLSGIYGTDFLLGCTVSGGLAGATATVMNTVGGAISIGSVYTGSPTIGANIQLLSLGDLFKRHAGTSAVVPYVPSLYLNGTFVENTGHGISGGRSTVLNSIFAGNGGYGINNNLTTTSAAGGYNLFWDNTSGSMLNWQSVRRYAAADPLFAHAAGDSFKLQAGSPAINKGNSFIPELSQAYEVFGNVWHAADSSRVYSARADTTTRDVGLIDLGRHSAHSPVAGAGGKVRAQ